MASQAFDPLGPSGSLGPAAASPHSRTVGIVLIVLGLLAMVLPFFFGVAITAIIGWVLLLAGIAHVFHAFSTRSTGSAVWQVVIGIAYLITALYLILHPASGLLTLTLLLAVYFVVEGIFELVIYFRLRQRHRASWTLWNGIITLILGVLIWRQWPFSSAWAVGTLIGISLLFSGIARLTYRPHATLPGSGALL